MHRLIDLRGSWHIIQHDQDVDDTEERVRALETEAQALETFKETTNAVLPFARVKWAGSLQKTNASGVWTQALPGGLMKNGLTIVGPVVRGSGDYSCAANVTGTAAGGYTVTLTFSRRRSQIQIPAVVIGAAALNVSLNETSVGVITFDIAFAEPDVIGP